MSPAIRSLVLAIMNTALACNNRETGPAIFVDFAGHCERLDVRMYPSGYNKGGKMIILKTAFLEWPDAAAQLVNLHSELRALIDSAAGVHALPTFAEAAAS